MKPHPSSPNASGTHHNSQMGNNTLMTYYCYYNIYGPTEEDIDAAITKYSQLVKHIHVTELDIRVNQEMGGQLRFSRGENKPLAGYLNTMLTDQYNRVFKVFRKHKDVIDCVTLWNLGDRDSWLGLR